MRSAVVLVGIMAGLAAASPIVQRALVTDVVTDIVIVYVTEGAPAATTHAPILVSTTSTTPTTTSTTSVHVASTSSAVVTEVTTTSSSIPPIVAPTTSAAVVVPETTTSEVPVPTSTTKAPAAASSTSQAPTSAATTISTNVDLHTCSGITPGTDYQSTALYHHNIHRCNHSAPSVTYSQSLASSAAVLAATCNFHHDVTIGGGGYGQNIASFGTTGNPQSLDPSLMLAQATTNMWYNGELAAFLPSYYGEANPDFSNFEGYGHLTQVVWVATSQVGCASQYCPAGGLFSTLGGWFTVCNYAAAGNMGGGYGTNVLKPLGHPTITA